jgi:hypothetical protein
MGPPVSTLVITSPSTYRGRVVEALVRAFIMQIKNKVEDSMEQLRLKQEMEIMKLLAVQGEKVRNVYT